MHVIPGIHKYFTSDFKIVEIAKLDPKGWPHENLQYSLEYWFDDGRNVQNKRRHLLAKCPSVPLSLNDIDLSMKTTMLLTLPIDELING